MRNYAEELVYWYLRLQGFLLINDWISHSYPNNTGDQENGQDNCGTNKINVDRYRVLYNDSDILAVRLCSYKEYVGDIVSEQDNKTKLWDCSLFKLLKIDNPSQKTIGLVCSISASSNRPPKKYDTDCNDNNIKEAARKRIGTNEDETKYILFGNIKPNGEDSDWKFIPLKTVNKYLKLHLSVEEWGKSKAWHLYPSNLLQYLLKHQRGDPCPPSPPTA